MKHPIMKRPVKQTTERRISATLRLALVLVLLVVNVASVMLLSYFLQAHSALVLTIIMEAAAILVAINIQSSSSSGSYKLAWTLLVVAVPVAGLILYVLWGGNIQSKRLNLLPVKAPANRGAEKRQSEANLERLGEVLPNWRRTAAMLDRRQFLLYRETDVTYFPGGDAFFADALSRMSRAERFIFLEYFIIEEGYMWGRVLRILEDITGLF